MYVDIALGENSAATLARQNAVGVPAGAIQMIGNTQVVYVATDQAGVFVQRQVNAGPESSGVVPVYSGVAPGERVVTDGSFLLRAESLKQKPDQLDSSTRNLR
jgi:multidrug efflux pump subunit AcrA (membrane-fusion protein)